MPKTQPNPPSSNAARQATSNMLLGIIHQLMHGNVSNNGLAYYEGLLKQYQKQGYAN